ncbi:PTS system, fructoselysine/glucoselysine-specific IIA component [Enterococcus sp. DIV0212c]|uniref:PTS sugar transporter subunit IIA n=1 Tax=Candidatus Enterococcus ikei TaxID=2815326 RepID=A0ABS3GYS1_9ENTE|nr:MULTISPECIES: PTS sugar transporter subunit IIA [unclassified Enterococcus]MBO0440048.1 PTS sugar transporter subunit IIA [Enterococcus sp. DIV0869a]MBO1353992.1 PTS sugar transporter subunit IIA [Enterococcus sp. DIV0212c]
MARKIILATHGNFAEGIRTSLELICGQSKNVEVVCAYMKEEFDLGQTVEMIISENQENELLVITDIFGGSVNNEFFKYVEYPNVHLVSGLNLSLLIEMYTQLENAVSLERLIIQAIKTSQETIQYCNLLKVKEEEEEF